MKKTLISVAIGLIGVSIFYWLIREAPIPVSLGFFFILFAGLALVTFALLHLFSWIQKSRNKSK